MLLSKVPAALAELAVTPLREPTKPFKLLFTVLRLPATSFSTAWSNDSVLALDPLVKPPRLLAKEEVVPVTLLSSVPRGPVALVRLLNWVLVMLGNALVMALTVPSTELRLLATSLIELPNVLRA
jgi:hypothetical protein